MKNVPPKIVVAGHICLDIIPTFPDDAASSIEPGKLTITGPAVCSTGGAVSNTGLALHHLGVPTTLLGKVSDDLFGGILLDLLRKIDPRLAEGMLVAEGDSSSHTTVISPPGVDRSFLHCPGANDTFRTEDVNFAALAGAKLFHFGYPPIMRQFHENDGEEMSGLLMKAKEQGMLTSLDMALPDPNSPAGRVNWRTWLKRVLPSADVFLPSIDEILFMLHRERFNELSRKAKGGDLGRLVDVNLLGELADELLAMGTGVVVFKLGDQGLYLRSGATSHLTETWQNRELLAPCFEVDVVGTTGAGDCTIAGFLAAVVDNVSPAEALVNAVAVGAYSVEVADATSGIRPLEEVWERIAAGWERSLPVLELSDWSWDKATGCWRGPRDGKN